jgi:hypothetical protein
MNGSSKHFRLGAAALIAGSLTLAATAGFAMPRYDGVWSVSIVTKKGDCSASYRYPLSISNGVLANGGVLPVNVSGRVAASGAIKVTVSSGDKSATGFGKLAGNAGSGSWSGSGCSGSWTAERRSS